MLNAFAFLGVSLIFAILFSFVNDFHMKQEKKNNGSFLERVSLLLMLPLFLFGLPVMVLCSPINKLASKQLESLHKRELSIKYDMLLDTYQKRVAQLDKEIADLKDLLWNERLTHHEEEFKRGERSGFREGFKQGYFSCYDTNNLPKSNKWESLIKAWDSIDINTRLCKDNKFIEE